MGITSAREQEASLSSLNHKLLTSCSPLEVLHLTARLVGAGIILIGLWYYSAIKYSLRGY